MRTGLTTRVERIAKRIAKRIVGFAPIVCTLYDTDDSDIVGLTAGNERVARLPGETLDELLERARASTGIPMWVADYGDLKTGEVE